MISVVLVGAGGHCKSTIEILESLSVEYEITGILDPSISGSLYGYPILGNDDLIKDLVKDNSFIITVGSIKTTKIRETLEQRIIKENGRIVSCIANSAIVSKRAVIGSGTVVFNHTHVNVDCRIGRNCILNTASNIEHDCVLGDFVHVSTGAMINGYCTIGNHCFIGSNATIINGISITDDVIIGAGTVVIEDILDSGVYVGNPAKRI